MNEELKDLVRQGKLTDDQAKKLGLLEPGVLCFHQSWGVGLMKSWDLVRERVTVDFVDKADHPLKISSAPDCLYPIPDFLLNDPKSQERASIKELSPSLQRKLIDQLLSSGKYKISYTDLEEIIFVHKAAVRNSVSMLVRGVIVICLLFVIGGEKLPLPEMFSWTNWNFGWRRVSVMEVMATFGFWCGAVWLWHERRRQS